MRVNAKVLEDFRDRVHQGWDIPGGYFLETTASYILIGLNAEKYPPDINTDAIARNLLWRQRADGQWSFPDTDFRPPLSLDHIGQTALAMADPPMRGLFKSLQRGWRKRNRTITATGVGA